MSRTTHPKLKGDKTISERHEKYFNLMLNEATREFDRNGKYISYINELEEQIIGDITKLDITKLDKATTSFYNVTVPLDAVKGLFDFGPAGTFRGVLIHIFHSCSLYLQENIQ